MTPDLVCKVQETPEVGLGGGQERAPFHSVVLSRLLFLGPSSPPVCDPLADRDYLIHAVEGKPSCQRLGVPCSLALESESISRVVVIGGK